MAVDETYTLAGTAYTFAGASAGSVVSFGNTADDGTINVRQLRYVGAGRISATSTDAVNGSQLYAAYEAIGVLDNRITTLEGKSYVEKVEPSEDGLTFTQVTGKNDSASGGADGSDATVSDTSNKTTVTYTDKHITDIAQTIDGSGTITTTITTNEAGADESSKTYEATVDISDYVAGAINSQAGDGIIQVDGKQTTIKDAINANQAAITELQNSNIGEISNMKEDIEKNKTDIADNKAKIEENTSRIETNSSRIDMLETSVADNTSRISALDSRMNKVGAGAAALAALHPLDYDMDNKFSVSAGYGNYAGESAAAIGAFYRPNEKVMLSMAGTIGSGADMVNCGVTFAIGRGVGPYRAKDIAGETIADLRGQNEQLRANIQYQSIHIADQDNRISAQEERIASQEERIEQQADEIAELKALVKTLLDKAKTNSEQEN